MELGMMVMLKETCIDLVQEQERKYEGTIWDRTMHCGLVQGIEN